MDDSISLTEFPRALKAYTGGRTIRYSTAYQLVLDGSLPAAKNAKGRWVIARADLPKIAASLGMEAH